MIAIHSLRFTVGILLSTLSAPELVFSLSLKWAENVPGENHDPFHSNRLIFEKKMGWASSVDGRCRNTCYGLFSISIWNPFPIGSEKLPSPEGLLWINVNSRQMEWAGVNNYFWLEICILSQVCGVSWLTKISVSITGSRRESEKSGPLGWPRPSKRRFSSLEGRYNLIPTRMGCNSKADELRMGEKTVSETRTYLMEKVCPRKMSSAVRSALEKGVVSLYEVLESRFSNQQSGVHSD